MARSSAFDERTLDLRKATVTLAVVVAHVALIIVMLRSAGRSGDVVDITLFSLPISPEDRLREPVHAQNPDVVRTAATVPRHAAVAREPATEQHVKPSRGESSPRENDTSDDTGATHTGAASEAVPPIDWYADIETSAHTVEQHDMIESGRRSLAGPKQPAVSAAPQKPVCPYDKCEPGWGGRPGDFQAVATLQGGSDRKCEWWRGRSMDQQLVL